MSRLSRFRNWWRDRPIAQEIDEEIQFHLDRRAEKNVREGLSRAEAEREARRWFGNVTRARESMREARVAGWLDDLARDLRGGARTFARQPMLTTMAVVTLSLGIGANAAIFSALDAALFRPFPFSDAGRIVMIVDGARSGGRTSPTIPEVLDVRARTRTLAGVSFFDTRDFQIAGGAEPARVFAARVDPAFLPLLGARPALGRLLTADDSAPGSAPSLVLGDGLWRRNFGADPAVIGRALVVDGTSFTIVGVTAPEFSIDTLAFEPVEMFLPYPLIAEYTSRAGEFANVRRVTAIGRLRADASPATASADLQAIGAALAAEHPQIYRAANGGEAGDFVMDVQPLREWVSAGVRPPLLMLFGAVFLVLLIACVNAAQFLLAQAAEREPEVALRGALGAGRGRLVRQFLSETCLLALAAGVLGLLQAAWLVGVLRALLGESVLFGGIRLDLPVLLFTMAIAMSTVVVCGLVPAIRFSRVPVAGRLDTRGVRRRGRARQIFVAVEIALSVTLLIEAGLLLRTLHVLQHAQAGFSSETVTVMRIRGTLDAAYRQFAERIAAVPGVAAVTLTSGVLPGRPGTPFTIVGQSVDASTRARQLSSYQIVSPAYFAVLRIPLLQVRTFANLDTAGTLPVAVVNEEMARQGWPGSSPIGRQVRAGIGPRERTMTVIGVVGNVRPPFQNGDVPQLYVSYLQQGEPNMAVMVRPVEGGVVPVDAVKQAIWSVEPRQAVFNIRPLDEMLDQALAGQRVVAVLLGTFATLAVAISIAGVFTVVSYLTSRRVKEIALRRAIGAQGADVFWLLAGQTLRWALAGLAVGVTGAVIASRAVRAAVAGVVPLDAPIVVVAGGLYVAVVAFAVAWPALKALRVDPATALRAD